mmetsp:Transcript_25266/g.59142  ORF Transcript_25266/g.59142 Transcript_25266/m.59142 type:complete len:81 (-) Transcript_25266:1141-1383(-)
MALRLRLFVKRIPVNMMNDASRKPPPITYFNLVTHEWCPPPVTELQDFGIPEALDTPLLRAFKFASSVHSWKSYDEHGVE